jgi:acyl dehydratase
MSERFFEDFAVGQIFASTRRLRVGKDEIIAFAKQFDPQPFHLDEQAARNSIFGGLVASGWYTAALTMRLVTESEFRSAAGTTGLGFDELRWPVPVRPGDELRIESEVLDVRLSKSRPDQGLMKMRILTLNQQGQVVQELVANELVPRAAMRVKRHREA